MGRLIRGLREALDSLCWGISGLFDRSDLTIRFRPSLPLRFRGRIPRSQVAGIAAFLAHDLGSRSTVTIKGTRSGGIWRLRFSGGLSRPEAQRLRNFLIEHLR